MAHLVTSAQQTDHVTSANAAHFTAGSLTPGNYVLPVRGRMAVEIVDANTVRISGGDAVCCGRHWEVEGDFEDVTIDNGTPGLKRVDLVVARIWTAPDEGMELAVIRGRETDGEPEVPEHAEGDLLGGDTLVEVPVCSIFVDGIHPDEPVRLLDDLRTVSVEQAAASAAVEYFESNGADCVRVSATDSDGVRRGVQVESSGVVRMTEKDNDNATKALWSLPVNNVVMDWRGNATDLSYAALHSLAPGMYLVPSTAANQPISGQGDGNMLVGRNASNRVWAMVAYNTGAIYAAYGYTSGSSTTNFKWMRIDNNESALFRRQRGAVGASAADPGDISFPKLYELGANPGTYLIFPNTVNNPSPGNHGNMFLARSAGGRIVCLVFSDSGAVYGVRGYGSQQSDGSYSAGTWAWVRIDNNGVSGVSPIDRGGTGATTVKGAAKALFPTANQSTATGAAVMQSDGGYSGWLSWVSIMHKMFDESCDDKSGYSFIPAFNGSWADGAYYTLSGLLYQLGISVAKDDSAGYGRYLNVNPARSGSNPFQIATIHSTSNSAYHELHAGNLTIVTGLAQHVQVGNQAVRSDTINFGLKFAAAPIVLLSDSVDHEEYAAGAWVGFSASAISTTNFKLERYNGAGYQCTMGCYWVAIGRV